MATAAGHPVPPVDAGGDTPAHLRRHGQAIGRAVVGLLAGKANNIGTVTLTAGATSTVLSDARLARQSWIGWDPLTANAAAELAAGTLYVAEADRNAGAFTITHANAATADRTFRFLISG